MNAATGDSQMVCKARATFLAVVMKGLKDAMIRASKGILAFWSMRSMLGYERMAAHCAARLAPSYWTATYCKWGGDWLERITGGVYPILRSDTRQHEAIVRVSATA